MGAVYVCQREVLYGSAVRAATLVIALLFSFRIDSGCLQQSADRYLIFGLIIFGLAAFARVPVLASTLMAIAAGLKANPLFMVLLPIYKKSWAAAAVFLGLTVVLVVAPDYAKYAVSDNWGDSSFTVLVLCCPNGTRYRRGSSRRKPSPVVWSYLREHYEMTLSVSPDEVRWWQDRGSAGNQSLYRIAATRLGHAVPSNIVLLGLCSGFALLLLLASRVRKDAVFVLGLLFYTAFVLIGPQSSKPHFIAFFGLLLFCWQGCVGKTVLVEDCCLGSVLQPARHQSRSASDPPRRTGARHRWPRGACDLAIQLSVASCFRRENHSGPNLRRHTSINASLNVCPDILDTPTVRSVKWMGTSVTLSPLFSAPRGLDLKAVSDRPDLLEAQGL